jgi:hypothetical protein
MSITNTKDLNIVKSDHYPIKATNKDIKFMTYNIEHCYNKYKKEKKKKLQETDILINKTYCIDKEIFVLTYIIRNYLEHNFDIIFLQECTSHFKKILDEYLKTSNKYKYICTERPTSIKYKYKSDPLMNREYLSYPSRRPNECSIRDYTTYNITLYNAEKYEEYNKKEDLILNTLDQTTPWSSILCLDLPETIRKGKNYRHHLFYLKDKTTNITYLIINVHYPFIEAESNAIICTFEDNMVNQLIHILNNDEIPSPLREGYYAREIPDNIIIGGDFNQDIRTENTNYKKYFNSSIKNIYSYKCFEKLLENKYTGYTNFDFGILKSSIIEPDRILLFKKKEITDKNYIFYNNIYYILQYIYLNLIELIENIDNDDFLVKKIENMIKTYKKCNNKFYIIKCKYFNIIKNILIILDLFKKNNCIDKPFLKICIYLYIEKIIEITKYYKLYDIHIFEYLVQIDSVIELDSLLDQLNIDDIEHILKYYYINIDSILKDEKKLIIKNKLSDINIDFYNYIENLPLTTETDEKPPVVLVPEKTDKEPYVILVPEDEEPYVVLVPEDEEDEEDDEEDEGSPSKSKEERKYFLLKQRVISFLDIIDIFLQKITNTHLQTPDTYKKYKKKINSFISDLKQYHLEDLIKYLESIENILDNFIHKYIITGYVYNYYNFYINLAGLEKTSSISYPNYYSYIFKKELRKHFTEDIVYEFLLNTYITDLDKKKIYNDLISSIYIFIYQNYYLNIMHIAMNLSETIFKYYDCNIFYLKTEIIKINKGNKDYRDLFNEIDVITEEKKIILENPEIQENLNILTELKSRLETINNVITRTDTEIEDLTDKKKIEIKLKLRIFYIKKQEDIQKEIEIIKTKLTTYFETETKLNNKLGNLIIFYFINKKINITRNDKEINIMDYILNFINDFKKCDLINKINNFLNQFKSDQSPIIVKYVKLCELIIKLYKYILVLLVKDVLFNEDDNIEDYNFDDLNKEIDSIDINNKLKTNYDIFKQYYSYIITITYSFYQILYVDFDEVSMMKMFNIEKYIIYNVYFYYDSFKYTNRSQYIYMYDLNITYNEPEDDIKEKLKNYRRTNDNYIKYEIFPYSNTYKYIYIKYNYFLQFLNEYIYNLKLIYDKILQFIINFKDNKELKIQEIQDKMSKDEVLLSFDAEAIDSPELKPAKKPKSKSKKYKYLKYKLKYINLKSKYMIN